jgi:hypothetical protein
MRRKEFFSASYSAMKFCADVISMVFLLNRRYAPFYKWLHRAVRDLPLLGPEVHRLIESLLVLEGAEDKADVMESISVLRCTPSHEREHSGAIDLVRDLGAWRARDLARPHAEAPPSGSAGHGGTRGESVGKRVQLPGAGERLRFAR